MVDIAKKTKGKLLTIFKAVLVISIFQIFAFVEAQETPIPEHIFVEHSIQNINEKNKDGKISGQK